MSRITKGKLRLEGKLQICSMKASIRESLRRRVGEDGVLVAALAAPLALAVLAVLLYRVPVVPRGLVLRLLGPPPPPPALPRPLLLGPLRRQEEALVLNQFLLRRLDEVEHGSPVYILENHFQLKFSWKYGG